MDLFVVGLPLDLDELGLINFFKIYGISVKSAKIIKDKSTGLSKGFGFVTVKKKEEAQLAIEKLDGKFFERMRISVQEAKPLSKEFKQKNNYFVSKKWSEKIENEGDL